MDPIPNKASPDVRAKLEADLGVERRKPKYGEPGALMRTSDGTIYLVYPDGSWRRYKGGVSDPTGGLKNNG